MPYAKNAMDERRVYFEDDGGDGPAVVIHGGFGEPVELVRASPIARALPVNEFRIVHVDHRGHGRSDKPHHAAAYAMPLRVADAVAVLDELDIGQAHARAPMTRRRSMQPGRRRWLKDRSPKTSGRGESDA